MLSLPLQDETTSRMPEASSASSQGVRPCKDTVPTPFVSCINYT
jgi:hypothetical protein